MCAFVSRVGILTFIKKSTDNVCHLGSCCYHKECISILHSARGGDNSTDRWDVNVMTSVFVCLVFSVMICHHRSAGKYISSSELIQEILPNTLSSRQKGDSVFS